MAQSYYDTSRTVLRLSGGDTLDFLQNLVTNDVSRLGDGLLYAALLTPQGKYLADFFLLRDGEDVLLDADAAQAPGLAQRLGMYRLRANVSIDTADIAVTCHWGESALPGHTDPRDTRLGTRSYGPPPAESTATRAEYDALRVARAIPSAGAELVPNDSFILEMDFERLSGVDFKKGCYVGQEVTARMKHKTELRKGLARVALDGVVDPSTPITTPEGKPAGTLHTVSGNEGLAYLRFDRATGPLVAGEARLTHVV